VHTRLAHRPVCHTYLLTLLSLSVLPADSITEWTLAEQDAWIADPQGPAAFRDCIGIVDATYVRVQRPKEYALEC
jgi:hypothetical protein